MFPVKFFVIYCVASCPQMAIIFSEEDLKDVKPPCVIQSFINHNAVLYKVFVVGDSYTVVERPSLKNFPAGPAGKVKNGHTVRGGVTGGEVRALLTGTLVSLCNLHSFSKLPNKRAHKMALWSLWLDLFALLRGAAECNWVIPCWYMLSKLDKSSSVFLHKHVKSFTHDVSLNTGLSPDTNSSICMWYSRGPHANHFCRQRSRPLCVTVQTGWLVSAWNAGTTEKLTTAQQYTCTALRSLSPTAWSYALCFVPRKWWKGCFERLKYGLVFGKWEMGCPSQPSFLKWSFAHQAREWMSQSAEHFITATFAVPKGRFIWTVMEHTVSLHSFLSNTDSC